MEVFKLLGLAPQWEAEISHLSLLETSAQGMKRALVVHGCEGLDELSIAGKSKVGWKAKAFLNGQVVYSG